MRPRSRTLTAQELEIMKIVWSLKTATVRDVYEDLLKRRKIAYTTVMTMMKILEDKHYLKKRPARPMTRTPYAIISRGWPGCRPR